MCTHWYLFYVTVIRVRLEVVITELVFEHSLRIRLKAEASGDGTASTPSQPVSKATSVASTDETDDDTVEGEHAARNENESASTAFGSSRTASESTQATIKGKGKATPENLQTQPEKKSGGDTENLMGKINSFVTSDLRNILEGSDFLSFGMACVILCDRVLAHHPYSIPCACSDHSLFHLSLQDTWLEVISLPYTRLIGVHLLSTNPAHWLVSPAPSHLVLLLDTSARRFKM